MSTEQSYAPGGENSTPTNQNSPLTTGQTIHPLSKQAQHRRPPVLPDWVLSQTVTEAILDKIVDFLDEYAVDEAGKLNTMWLEHMLFHYMATAPHWGTDEHARVETARIAIGLTNLVRDLYHIEQLAIAKA